MSNSGKRIFGSIDGTTGPMVSALWALVCLVTLGFPAKYRERLRLFECLVPAGSTERWSTPPTYSDRGDDEGSQKTMRQKQQEEWDRLNIAVSVITATSAAALAIQATSIASGPPGFPPKGVYWLVTAFYSTAFGLSLQGLILITYMTIAAGASSDEAIGRLARGQLISVAGDIVKPTALIMALPAILATYSSIFLLAGLAVMVLRGPGVGVETKSREYIVVTMIPVGIAFLFLCVAIFVCELGVWTEIKGRRNYQDKHGPYPQPPKKLVGHCQCCRALAIRDTPLRDSMATITPSITPSTNKSNSTTNQTLVRRGSGDR